MAETVVIGDSLVKNLSRTATHQDAPDFSLLGIGGDRCEHLLWRIENGEVGKSVKDVFLLCGTNNLDKNSAGEIANTLLKAASNINKNNPTSSPLVNPFV